MTVELYPYDPQWALLFDEAKLPLSVALGEHAKDIQHVGSTSIPGLAAKPVIDIAVSLDRYPLPDDVIAAVEALGYEHMGEYGIKGRHCFRRPAPPIKYHLHMYALDNGAYQDHVLFRDYLRAHPEAMREYEALKRQLAEQYEDVNDYADNKRDFVRATLEKALAWRDGRETPPVQTETDNIGGHGEGGERGTPQGEGQGGRGR